MWILKMNYFSARLIKGPKLIRLIFRAIMIPIWYVFQILAPLLDKLDRNPELETSGYTVVAKKI